VAAKKKINKAPSAWATDIEQSVQMYNEWYLSFAPSAFNKARTEVTRTVTSALAVTGNLQNINFETIKSNPEILPVLRMCTCPPLAVDRLIGLSGVSSSMIKKIEDERCLPPRMKASELDAALSQVCSTILALLDKDIFPWIEARTQASTEEFTRAATIVSDRLSGAVANPAIRNAQEERQLAVLETWLVGRGYSKLPGGNSISFQSMPPGTFSFRLNVPVQHADEQVNIPVDAVVMPLNAELGQLPVLLEAKSAGDFTNVNKRRKEEAQKADQLRMTYPNRDLQFHLFLCGYFNEKYLSYERSAGIDWVWEHRPQELEKFGL
jgi:hypothetical protein